MVSLNNKKEKDYGRLTTFLWIGKIGLMVQSSKEMKIAYRTVADSPWKCIVGESYDSIRMESRNLPDSPTYYGFLPQVYDLIRKLGNP